MRRGPLEAKGTQRTYPKARPAKKDMVSRLWQGKDISKTMRVARAKAQVMGAPSWRHMVCPRLGTTLKWAKTPAEDTRPFSPSRGLGTGHYDVCKTSQRLEGMFHVFLCISREC